MDISISIKLDGNSALVEFICDLIIEELTADVVAIAPELAEENIFADNEFQALCANAIGGGSRRLGKS